MGDIKRVVLIDRSMIDEHNYFDSLLTSAYEKGIVNEKFLEVIQQDLVSLLAYKCRRYTSGESSSVPVEVAENIMHSVSFTISIYLKQIPEPEDALYELKRLGAGECCSKGMNIIKELLKNTKLMYEQIKRSMVKIDNYIYTSTLIEGIQGFFKIYEYEFSAHEIHITADYPVCVYPQKYEGIEFIREYLKNVWCENRFCNLFADTDVKRVLAFFAVDYEDILADMVFNIYEVILSNALACAIAGEDILSLNLSDEGKEKVNETFSRNMINGNDSYDLTTYADDVLDAIGADKEIREYTTNICNSVKKTVLFISET